VDFYTTILLERFMHGEIYARYRCEYSIFKVVCMTMPKTWADAGPLKVK
jgi:hypothetical protein